MAFEPDEITQEIDHVSMDPKDALRLKKTLLFGNRAFYFMKGGTARLIGESEKINPLLIFTCASILILAICGFPHIEGTDSEFLSV